MLDKTSMSLGEKREYSPQPPALSQSSCTNNNHSIELVYNTIDNSWALIKQASIYQARLNSEKLVRYLEREIQCGSSSLLRALAHAYFVAGYTTSMSSSNRETKIAIPYMEKMEEAAQTLNDPILLTIAFTYHGDMLRRCDNLEKAQIYLQKAYEITAGTDIAAHGNSAHLLARLSLKMQDMRKFERLMREAEEIAIANPVEDNSVHGQYCLGTVYIEYARASSQQKNFQKAMDYLDMAEKAFILTPHWQTLLLGTKAMILLKGGLLDEGLPAAVEAARLCKLHGNRRLLNHLTDLQSFLEQQAIQASRVAATLGEAIHGSFDL